METSGDTRPMTLGRLCAEAGVTCPAGAEDLILHGLTADSRRVRPGWLFIALDGMHTDGRTYVEAAARAGAVAVVYRKGPDLPGTVEATASPAVVRLPVEDVRLAMAHLFDAWYDHPGRRLRLVGITGTNGKTTVACLLTHMLRAAGCPCGMIGTLGVEGASPEATADARRICPAEATAAMTTPDPEELYAQLARLAEEGQGEPVTVVVEVTSHALALHKVAPLDFDLAVFTNLSPEHMDFHGTAENYFEAKKKLFAHARRAVVNADDRWGRALPTGGFPVKTWMLCHATPGPTVDAVPPQDGHIRCCAEGIRPLGLDGTEYRLRTPDVRLRLRCPLPGAFSVINSMEAAVAALALGAPPGVVKESLATFPGVPGRLERLSLGDVDFSVFIDFAHTPDALENLLRLFWQVRKEASGASGRSGEAGTPIRRIVLLFGCGGDRDRTKRRAMAHVASRMADAVVITSDNSRSEDPMAIIDDILTGIDRESEYTVIPERAEAIRYVIRHARPGDVILLCGKGHESYEIDRTGRHPFSEREVVYAALRERAGE